MLISGHMYPRISYTSCTFIYVFCFQIAQNSVTMAVQIWSITIFMCSWIEEKAHTISFQNCLLQFKPEEPKETIQNKCEDFKRIILFI